MPISQAALYLPLVHWNIDLRLICSILILRILLLLLLWLAFFMLPLHLLRRRRGPFFLHELQVDVVWVCYLLSQPQLASIDRARRLLLEIKFDRLALHN